ncbi:glucosaminidase domain-containing protein [Desulforamulus profundi]|uniref:glucosaminidase domain-containing protein n=1 Tax=Desulforamulus profundi TaxID=1383067 RepID=UPI001EE548E6|nr:glucosaminidase domain-containing protein [Desulforamulus profundi]
MRADVAWAQALKETGYFKYGGIVLPEQNNYSGIGALNNNAKGEAAVFESPRIGVRAQIQHLKAYASTEALKQPCADPRFHLVKRGSAKYVEWLGYEDNPNGTGWAWPGKGYGYSIVGILKGILQEPKESKEATDTGNVPQWQKDAFKKLVERKIINSPEFWEGRLGETITIGEVMGILANTL